MPEVTDSIKQVRSVGGMGLDYLGLPPSTGSGSAGSRDLYLHMTLYKSPDGFNDDDERIDPPYSWASLSGELHMLEAQGLIHVEETLTPEQEGYGRGVLMEVRWRYTDAGAKAVIQAWYERHGEYPGDYSPASA